MLKLFSLLKNESILNQVSNQGRMMEDLDESTGLGGPKSFNLNISSFIDLRV